MIKQQSISYDLQKSMNITIDSVADQNQTNRVRIFSYLTKKSKANTKCYDENDSGYMGQKIPTIYIATNERYDLQK